MVMKVGWYDGGKHSNKARHLAESSEKFGHQHFKIGKKTRKNMDVIITYGNKIPKVDRRQIFLNIHSGYLSRPNFHRISIGGYHPGDYIMDLDYPVDRYRAHRIKLNAWRQKADGYILVCDVSVFNLGMFGLNYHKEIPETVELIKKYTSREIVVRSRTMRRVDPLEKQFRECWAIVTWSSNCAVEAIIDGVPCFLRTGAAASPMCLTDLSRIEDPYYPDNRKQWLKNLSYLQFTVPEIINGFAWETVMHSQIHRGVVVK
jgi:hypothetical protein